MARTVTITVDDTVYETLKPFIEQQTIGKFLSEVIGKNPSQQTPHAGIVDQRGSLHPVDTTDLRDENDRIL